MRPIPPQLQVSPFDCFKKSTDNGHKAYDLLCVRDRSIEIFSIEPDPRLASITSYGPPTWFIKCSLILPLPEGAVSNGWNASSEGSEKDSIGEPGEYTIAPQTIVLVVEIYRPAQEPYSQLIFVYPYRTSTNDFIFPTYECLLNKKSDNTIKTRMTTDTRRRILALSQESRHITLYKLVPWEVIRGRVEHNKNIDEEELESTQEERRVSFENDQHIWFMEFVPSPETDIDTAYLVVLTGTPDKRCTLMHLCKIDCKTDLNEQRLNISLLGTLGDPTPARGLDQIQFVMPLQNLPGLILVSKDHIALLADVTRPVSSLYRHATDGGTRILADQLYSNTLSRKVTQTCGTLRENYNYTQNEYEIVFLVHEDGQVESIEFELASSQHLRTMVNPIVHLGCNVDEAFALIDLPGDEDWGFVTGGSFSDGRIMNANAQQYLEPWSLITNPEPVIDSVVVPSTTSQRKHVFATTNRAKYGSISEIRSGYTIRRLENIETNSVTSKIWILPYDDQVYLVTATATGTAHQLYVLEERLPGSEQSASWSLVDRGSNHPWFGIFEDEEDPIAFSLVREGYFLRITRSKIQKISADLTAIIDLRWEELHGCTIMLAYIDSFSSTALFFIIRSGIWVMYYLSSNEGQPSLTTITVVNEPSCIHIHHHIHHEEDLSLAVLSMHPNTLRIYALGPASIRLLRNYDIATADSVCESLLIVTRIDETASEDHEYTSLLCGFRSGLLKCFDFSLDDDNILHERGTICIGSTSVQLALQQKDSSSDDTKSSVIVFCEEMLYLFENDGQNFSESNLKQLWFTDWPGQGLRQPAVLSVELIPAWYPSVLVSSEDVFCVTRNAIWQSQVEIDDGPRYIPRKIHIGGSPNRVIWSNYHKRLVVGLLLELPITSQSQRLAQNEPLLFSAIAVIDPGRDDDEEQIKLEQESLTMDITELKNRYAAILDNPGEQISSLAEWNIIKNGKTYQMLLASVQGTPSGKVYLFNFRDADRPLELKAVWRAEERGSVYCVAAYDSTSFVVLTSNSLLQLSLNEESGSYRFRETTVLTLPSGGRAIRIDDGRIIVGTFSHSLMIFEIRNGGFQRVFSDNTGGNCWDSITVPLTSAIDSDSENQMETDFKEQITLQACHTQNYDICASQISGFYHRSSPGYSDYSIPMFHHSLPAHIMRLQQVSLRPPLRNNPYLPCPRILVSTIDGAWYSVDMVNLKTWHVLKYLQTLWLCRDHLSRPVWVEESRYLEFMPDTSYFDGRTVDGQILRQALSDSKDPEAMMTNLFQSDMGQKMLTMLQDAGYVEPPEDQPVLLARVVLQILRAVVDEP